MSTTQNQRIGARAAGARAWREVLADQENGALEFPLSEMVRRYGDEYQNPIAQSFRAGFDAEARRDGYTYSRVDGEYHEGGEFETDDFTPPCEEREFA